MCTIKWFTKCEGETVMALFDAEDFIKLNSSKNLAVFKNNKGKPRKRFQVYAGGVVVNRIISKCPTNLVCDHINNNSLDNRKQNLRNCTAVENNRNRRPHLGGTSSFKGVSREKKSGRWASQIYVNGKTLYKSFQSEQNAAYQYNIWAKHYFGEYAFLNVLPLDFVFVKEPRIKKQRRRVLCKNTGKTFKNCKEAADFLSLSATYVHHMLTGKRPNKTSLVFVEDEL